jgi:hypothetical protein
MKQYKNLMQIRMDESCPKEMVMEAENLIHSTEDDGVNLSDESFISLYGGDFFLIETEEDLKQIFTMVEDEITNKWLDITEVASTFDEARYTASGNFAVFCMITNNAGGPIWYTPRVIADTCPNIERSIVLSNDGEIAQYSID